MGSIGNCCCNCELLMESLPVITIPGMTADVAGWSMVGDCCFKRIYEYNSVQPREVTSVDVQRSYYHQTTSSVDIAKTLASLGCGSLFDCLQTDTENRHDWVERLGLIYQHQYIEVFIQLKTITCPYTGESQKILVSTRHAVGFRPSFLTVDFDTIATGTYTPLNSCCNGAESNDYDFSEGEPDWDDVTIWPDYSEDLTDGEYWNHKIYETIPDGTFELIDGCQGPCTSEHFCTPECESICVASEPSEIVPNHLGSPLCPSLDFVHRTCTVVYNNPFDGTTGCTTTVNYYSVSALSQCEPLLYAVYDGYACNTGVARWVRRNTIAFDYDVDCTFNFGAEICLNDPVTLQFPPLA